MASQARLRAGSPHGWPRQGFTLEENLQDLIRHEQEFHDRIAFAYTMVRPDESEVLGCVYINPPDPEDEQDARAYMWVRDEHHPDLTAILFDEVDAWLQRDWPDAAASILEGLDEMWSPVSSEGKADYRNLPPGKYEMEVVVRDRSTQIYVLDTTTGAVKWVDSMNTPFPTFLK